VSQQPSQPEQLPKRSKKRVATDDSSKKKKKRKYRIHRTPSPNATPPPSGLTAAQLIPPLPEESEDDYVSPLLSLPDFISCSIKAIRPRGGTFHEDTIEWFRGSFRWTLIEEFIEEVERMEVFSREHLKIESIYGYVNKRGHHLTADKTAGFERMIQVFLEDQAKVRDSKRKSLDVLVTVAYIIDQAAVLEEIRQAGEEGVLTQIRRQNTSRRRGQNVPTEIGRFTLQADLEDDEESTARKADVLSELRRYWQCNLGAACAAFRDGGICYVEGQNVPQNHYPIKEEELRFWRDEIIVNRSSVSTPSAGVLIKLRQTNRTGVIKKKTIKPSTQSQPQQWSSPGQGLVLNFANMFSGFGATQGMPTMLSPSKAPREEIESSPVQEDLMIAPSHLETFFDWLPQRAKGPWGEVKQTLLENDIEFQSLNKDITDTQWEKLGLSIGTFLTVRRHARAYKLVLKAQSQAQAQYISSGDDS